MHSIVNQWFLKYYLVTRYWSVKFQQIINLINLINVLIYNVTKCKNIYLKLPVGKVL